MPFAVALQVESGTFVIASFLYFAMARDFALDNGYRVYTTQAGRIVEVPIYL